MTKTERPAQLINQIIKHFQNTSPALTLKRLRVLRMYIESPTIQILPYTIDPPLEPTQGGRIKLQEATYYQ